MSEGTPKIRTERSPFAYSGAMNETTLLTPMLNRLNHQMKEEMKSPILLGQAGDRLHSISNIAGEIDGDRKDQKYTNVTKIG